MKIEWQGLPMKIEWQGLLMKQVLKVVIAGAVAAHFAQILNAQVISEAVSKSAIDMDSRTVDLPQVPPLPSARSTALGGEIQDIDPVLDRFTLHVYGLNPMKIFFDESTQLFLDGKKIPLRELRPGQRASVQTTLDGAAIFALSIHLLSQSACGDYEGKVLAYNPTTGELTVSSSTVGTPLTLIVSSDTTFVRKGQDAFSSTQSGPSDLQRGSLVSITFDSDNRGHAVANQIAVLATPGARFIFGGNVTAIDVHSGLLALVDPRDDRSYQAHFNSASLLTAQGLRVGQRVRVAVDYDGDHYQVREISPY